MKYAQLIREFLRSLFGSRFIFELQQEILELRKEREYFRGRAERLELMLLPNRNPLQAVQTRAKPLPRTGGSVSAMEAMRIHMENEFKVEEEKQNVQVG